MKPLVAGMLWGLVLMCSYLLGQGVVLLVLVLAMLGHMAFVFFKKAGNGLEEIWMGVIIGVMLGFGVVYLLRLTQG